MIIGIYSIFDRLAGLYGSPFYQLKKELAVRQFDYVMKNASMVSGDCDLYYLGEYNTETGEIMPVSKPEFIKHFTLVQESIDE